MKIELGIIAGNLLHKNRKIGNNPKSQFNTEVGRKSIFVIFMKKIVISLIMLVVFGFAKAQNSTVKNSLGTFSVKWLGRGDWNYATNEANKIGYRLPNIKEFKEIMNRTSGSHPMFTSLIDSGWGGFKGDSCYYWTSVDDNETWSDAARKTNAVVVWWGDSRNNGQSEEKLMEKSFGTLGIIVIKKIKNKNKK